MAGNPQEALATELRRLRRLAGEPSTREIARAISFSHTTVAQALNGSRCPRWNVVSAMVRHLRGDVETFRPLWQAVRDAAEPIPAVVDVQATGDDAAAQVGQRSAWQATTPVGNAGLPREDSYPPPDSWLGNPGGVGLSQPVLFVGLGGSGCDIGASLERRLRREFCGTDGNAFRKLRGQESRLPFELPACVQFVYADTDEAGLNQMARRVVPSSTHIPAVLRTGRYVHDLVPPDGAFGSLALNLRLQLEPLTAGWLPPAEYGPAPANGTAQFPTLGRAALFTALANGRWDGAGSLVRDLHEAVGRLATSGVDLHALGGKPLRSVTVFVAFSVAGGTGAGIFYDFLHLIAGTIRQNSSLQVKIYPLVVMPSAFPEGLGGGRIAELNASRALLDLFRLIDQQNAAGAELKLIGAHDRRPIDPEEAGVTYPGYVRIVMRPGTMPTAFLFPKPPGADRNDLHRTICSLIMSMAGTEFRKDNADMTSPGQASGDWVNDAAIREVPAADGIGNRGVSTALAASLTSPSDHLAWMISGRLLREAVIQLSSPNGKAESNSQHRERFIAAAGLAFLFADGDAVFAEPPAVNGARLVAAALAERETSIRAGLDAFHVAVERRTANDAQEYDFLDAALDLMKSLDVFRVQRVIFGHSGLEDDADKAGAAGRLLDYQTASPQPDGAGEPPAVPEFADRFPRRLVRWTDPVPTQVRQAQNAWCRQQTQVRRIQALRAIQARLQRPLSEVGRIVGELTRALTDFARADQSQFARQVAELYRMRAGLTYLLPFGGIDIEQLYVLVRNQLAADLDGQEASQPAGAEASLVEGIIAAGDDGWSGAFRISQDHGPEMAVAYIHRLVKDKVADCLRSTASGRSALLPEMRGLLATAAGHPGGDTSMRGYIEEFRDKLGTLIPARFVPQGDGPMKVMISYPADFRSHDIEVYLRESINLPRGPNIVYEMDNTIAESITAVMFRSSMGLTDVPEVRNVLRLWAGALAKPEQGDFLRWRQRTGYEFGYLATTEDHRTEILYRLLCALWNGKVTAEGDPASPSQVAIELDTGTLNLQMTGLEGASSWASLLRAYEWFTLDDQAHRLICADLMRELPRGLEEIPSPPSPLYVTLRDLAEVEIAHLDAILARPQGHSHDRAALMRRFWAQTLPTALDHGFAGIESPVAPNLRGLAQIFST